VRVCYLYYTVGPMVTESERKLRSEKYAMLHYNMYPRKKWTAAADVIIPDKGIVRIVHNIPAAPVRDMISKIILSGPARRWSAARQFDACSKI